MTRPIQSENASIAPLGLLGWRNNFPGAVRPWLLTCAPLGRVSTPLNQLARSSNSITELGRALTFSGFDSSRVRIIP